MRNPDTSLRCDHCEKVDTSDDPITEDCDGNQLCKACHAIEQQAQENEAIFS